MADDLRKAIGARIHRAQKRKYRFSSDAIEELERRHGKKVKASYYSHRSGTRLPDDVTLQMYADLFDVPIAYLRLGVGAEEIEGQDAQIKEDESERSGDIINQHRREFELKSSHKHPVRLIPILSADQIKDLRTGRGDLAQMSGRTLPVPDFLNASSDSFAFFIPTDDFSMVAPNGPSYAPGACIVIDPQRQITPGDRVFAEIEGFDDPVVRKYVAARPYAPGVRFRLEAFNPSFAAIEVPDSGEVRFIARVIWAAQEQ